MAVQQDPGPDVLVRAHESDVDALAIRFRRAQRQPDLGDVVRDQVRNRYGYALGERGLAHKGAHDLAPCGSSTSCSSQHRGREDAFTMRAGPMSFVKLRHYGRVLNEI